MKVCDLDCHAWSLVTDSSEPPAVRSWEKSARSVDTTMAEKPVTIKPRPVNLGICYS